MTGGRFIFYTMVFWAVFALATCGGKYLPSNPQVDGGGGGAAPG